jgi:hypothetical protein
MNVLVEPVKTDLGLERRADRLADRRLVRALLHRSRASRSRGSRTGATAGTSSRVSLRRLERDDGGLRDGADVPAAARGADRRGRSARRAARPRPTRCSPTPFPSSAARRRSRSTVPRRPDRHPDRPGLRRLPRGRARLAGGLHGGRGAGACCSPGCRVAGPSTSRRRGAFDASGDRAIEPASARRWRFMARVLGRCGTCWRARRAPDALSSRASAAFHSSYLVRVHGLSGGPGGPLARAHRRRRRRPCGLPLGGASPTGWAGGTCAGIGGCRRSARPALAAVLDPRRTPRASAGVGDRLARASRRSAVISTRRSGHAVLQGLVKPRMRAVDVGDGALRDESRSGSASGRSWWASCRIISAGASELRKALLIADRLPGLGRRGIMSDGRAELSAAISRRKNA